MRLKYLILTTIIVALYCCNVDNRQNELQDESLWTDSLKTSFVKKYSKTGYEKFALACYIDNNRYEISDSLLKMSVLKGIPDSILSLYYTTYYIDLESIAGKSKDEIEKIIGIPTKKEYIKSSDVGTCDKYTYLGNLIEIVFIEGKSDWITINNTPSHTIIKNPNDYFSINTFDDYTYVKVKTN